MLPMKFHLNRRMWGLIIQQFHQHQLQLQVMSLQLEPIHMQQILQHLHRLHRRLWATPQFP